MAENRTLEDFVREETEQPPAPTRDSATGPTTRHVDGPTADGEHETESAGSAPNGAGSGLETTYGWTPDGAACAACDDVVERRFRDDGLLVCPGCKDW